MLRIFCVLFVTVTLLSCVSTVQQYRGKTVEQAHVSKKSYEIGITYRVTVGNTVLRREEYTGYYVLEAFRPTNDFVISGGLMSAAFTFQGSANDTFPIVAQNENSNPMFAIPGTRFMMGINSEGYWDNTVASSNAMTSPIGSGRQYSLSPATTRFEATKMFKPKRGTNYINHELLLIGFSNAGIHLGAYVLGSGSTTC